MNPINRFNLATFLQLSKIKIWIANVICRGFVFPMSLGER